MDCPTPESTMEERVMGGCQYLQKGGQQDHQHQVVGQYRSIWTVAKRAISPRGNIWCVLDEMMLLIELDSYQFTGTEEIWPLLLGWRGDRRLQEVEVPGFLYLWISSLDLSFDVYPSNHYLNYYFL
jgi:hypothetical protein